MERDNRATSRPRRRLVAGALIATTGLAGLVTISLLVGAAQFGAGLATTAVTLGLLAGTDRYLRHSRTRSTRGDPPVDDSSR